MRNTQTACWCIPCSSIGSASSGLLRGTEHWSSVCTAGIGRRRPLNSARGVRGRSVHSGRLAPGGRRPARPRTPRRHKNGPGPARPIQMRSKNRARRRVRAVRRPRHDFRERLGAERSSRLMQQHAAAAPRITRSSVHSHRTPTDGRHCSARPWRTASRVWCRSHGSGGPSQLAPPLRPASVAAVGAARISTGQRRETTAT